MNRSEKKLTIRTPEGVEFSFLLAGPISRCLALIIDFAAKDVLIYAIGMMSIFLKIVSKDLSIGFWLIGYFVVSLCYSIFFEWHWRGQTIGKRLLRLRVIDIHGLRLQLSQVVIRNLLHAVDMLPVFYMVGGMSCVLSPRAQRLGDMAANTIVVHVPKIEPPSLDQLLKGKFNSLKKYPHLCSRLRQNVSPEEADLGLQAIMRRDTFEPVERIKLFAQIAAYFKLKVIFPEEDIESVSDEQYIRNVLDVVFSGTEKDWAKSKSLV